MEVQAALLLLLGVSLLRLKADEASCVWKRIGGNLCQNSWNISGFNLRIQGKVVGSSLGYPLCIPMHSLGHFDCSVCRLLISWYSHSWIFVDVQPTILPSLVPTTTITCQVWATKGCCTTPSAIISSSIPTFIVLCLGWSSQWSHWLGIFWGNLQSKATQWLQLFNTTYLRMQKQRGISEVVSSNRLYSGRLQGVFLHS